MANVVHQISLHLDAASRLSLSNGLRAIADRLDDGTIKKGAPVAGAMPPLAYCSIIYETKPHA